jgi:uncharacterized membrane protein
MLYLFVTHFIYIFVIFSCRVSSKATPAFNYGDSHADPEELFAGFNNETGVDDIIVPNLVHFVLFGGAGKVDFTTFLCILSAIKVFIIKLCISSLN